MSTNPVPSFDRNQEALATSIALALNNFDPHEQQKQQQDHHEQQQEQQQDQQHDQQEQQQAQQAQHLQLQEQIVDEQQQSSTETQKQNQEHQPQQVQQKQNQSQQQSSSVPVDPSITSESDADRELIQSTAQAVVNSTKLKLHQYNSLPKPPNFPKVSKPRVNKPGQKFGAKKRSWVWNWFVQDPIDCNIAICDFCGKVIKRLGSDKGSPKKLGEHLKTHKIDSTSFNSKRNGSQLAPLQPSSNIGDVGKNNININNNNNNNISNNNSNHYFNTLNSNQTTYRDQSIQPASDETNQFAQPGYYPPGITSSIDQFQESPYTQIKFQKEIVKFLVTNKLPLSVVKSKSFRQLIYTLRPGALQDLNELNHLYDPLLDVISNDQSDGQQTQQQQQQQQHQEEDQSSSNANNHGQTQENNDGNNDHINSNTAWV
ncbi:hypothetical protein WICMUC_002860 [Wickerhamomyces mucosus]|uniref:BED-type domain-containing protein n=1 Tax=Wickerhamomyces mucosus TaxID=1378264 RepID=A0A9P8PMI1_9ASCO|nr:hypothetical protein WICMUC_002860 [Wickerhamomyces mucosus]